MYNDNEIKHTHNELIYSLIVNIFPLDKLASKQTDKLMYSFAIRKTNITQSMYSRIPKTYTPAFVTYN